MGPSVENQTVVEEFLNDAQLENDATIDGKKATQKEIETFMGGYVLW